ncbi:MAG: DUF2288 domain-containing protein [Burkholderiaceae bacterium]|nr:DUF2288 domain-containing protein [Burkholderiaceae bacterium]
MTEHDPQNKDVILHAKLNLETAQMKWSELERFFASGTLVSVSARLDLVEVAVRFANDDKEQVAQWLAQGHVAKVSDPQALAWQVADEALWTVVVKPWILVQEELRQVH